MLYGKLYTPFLLLMTLVLASPEVSYSTPRLSQRGVNQGFLELYIDEDGGPDACASGTRVGDWVLNSENGQLVFGLRWMGPKDGPWDPWFSWDYDLRSGIWAGSAFKDPKSTLCGRFRNLRCYRDRLIEEVTPWVTQAVGQCTPEDIARFSLKDDVATHAFNVRITINGANIKIEPLEACCSPDGKCKKEVLWKRSTLCPEGADRTSSRYRNTRQPPG